jgi:hypothetical protein
MFDEQGMEFKVTLIQHATRVEMWIHQVKEKFLKSTPVRRVGVDWEFTDAPRNVKKKKLTYEKRQHTTFIKICVAYKCLIV